MRIEQLLNVGAFSGAQTLRAAMARAISFAEVTTKLKGSPTEFTTKLRAFLLDAASKLPTVTTDPEPEGRVAAKTTTKSTKAKAAE